MGRTRGGKRRTVLQLGEQKDSYLSRYGYNRQEDNEEEGHPYGGESESEDEEGSQYNPEETEEIPLPPMPVATPPKPKVDIDDKVANFLAEIDALEPEEEPSTSEVEMDTEPKVEPIDPKPSFQLNVDQIPSYLNPAKPEPPAVGKQEPKSVGSYKSMFVQGASEFTKVKEEKLSNGTKDVENQWPDEPISDWQQILDDNTQCYYYWNVNTNEVRWEIPSEYTQYLLLRKEYEEKVDRLTNEGKVKPKTSRQIRIAADGHHLIKPDTSSVKDKSTESKSRTEKGKDEGPCVSSTSSASEQPETTSKKNSVLKNKSETLPSYGPQLPDSTAAKSKKPQLVDALYDDESDECSSTDSEIDSEEEAEVKKRKKGDKKNENGEDLELDLDDIDKALEMALEKKKTKEDDSKSKSRKKSGEKDVKKKSLVEEMREQVQKKQETEARRKAAIEEMMARELERRVGPPRQSSVPDEPAFKPKIMDYEHGRKSRHSDYDHDASTSRSRSSDRDSKRKRDDRKSEKDKDRKRRKDDGHRKDDKEDRKKDRDDRKKDRHRDRDDKKSDSKRKDEKSKKDSESSSKKKEEKHEKKKSREEESPEKKVKEDSENSIIVEDEVDRNKKKTESNLALLANMRQQASELAELALSKLEFLEVTKKGLSKLQILLMELETRQYDWQSGGLDTEYFLKKLDEANLQLEHYEKNAAPPGWSCHWDRAYRRYFYMSKRSGRTQWDYPDEEEEEEPENEENGQESEREEMDAGSPEQSQASVNSSETSQTIMEAEQVTSTTASLLKNKADTTSAVVSSHLVVSPSAIAQLDAYMDKEITEEEESLDRNTDTSAAVPVHDPKAIESALNFIIGANSLALGAEPPPPGTGLDMLLIAPPPPPPPVEEYPSEQVGDPNESNEMTMNTAESHVDVQNDNQILNSSHHDVNPEEMLPVSMETNDLPMSDLPDLEARTYTESEAVEAVISKPPVVSFARPPQVLMDAGPMEGQFQGQTYSGSSYSASVPAISSEGQNYGLSSASVPYVTSSTIEGTSCPSLPAVSAMAAASSIDTMATGEPIHPGDKKKKKKDKDKDKSISSASLTLKKKNVSSLVQKWQKVKKEVEIEERHREEREQAIRQKLEEWKKDHS